MAGLRYVFKGDVTGMPVANRDTRKEARSKLKAKEGKK
jgi:hypothetical protein